MGIAILRRQGQHGDGFQIRPPSKGSTTHIGEVAERLTNLSGTNLDSEAGPEGVTYREVGHSAPGTGAYELDVPIKDRLLISERWQSG